MRQAFRSLRLQMSILIALSVLLIPIGTLATNHSPDPDQIWTGTVETAGFWGTMQLKLSHQGNQWKGESSFDVAGTHVSSSVRNLKIEGEQILFSTDVQVMDVRFTFHFDGKFYGSKLRGVVSVDRDDKTNTTGTWSLELHEGTQPGQAIIELPPPTGRYAVGRTSFHWKDPSRQEVMTDDAGDRREIIVQVWYPAQLPAKPSPAAAYFPDLELLRTAFSDSRGATLASVRSHAFADVRVAITRAPFPAVVFSPGASTSTFFYSSMIEELASHGYIVVGINHPYESLGVVFPDKRVAQYDESQVKDFLPFVRQRIEVRAADASFVIDNLTKLNISSPMFRGRINLADIGIFGHSRGGLAAAMACQHDRRFKACLNMDGGTLGGPFYADANATPPTQPFMWFIRFKPEPSDEQLLSFKMTRKQWNQNRDRVQSRVNGFFRSVKGGSYRVTLNGATHESFSDSPLLASNVDLDDLALRLRIARIVRDCTLAFFDTHLKDRPKQLLGGALTNYPEMTVERFEQHPNR